MIHGTLDTWQRYVKGPLWEKAFRFIESLNADSPVGKTVLQGDDLFGMVASYDTRPCEESALETHERYIDIQAAIVEAEGIDWFPRAMLEITTPYDKEKDAVFYHRPPVPAPGHLAMMPGHFVIFYPDDAHMCQLIVGDGKRTVKKVVVKVRIDAL